MTARTLTLSLTLTETDATWLLAALEDAKNSWSDLVETGDERDEGNAAEFKEAIRAVSEVERAVHMAWLR